MRRDIKKQIRWFPHEIEAIENALEPHQDFSDYVRTCAIDKAFKENSKDA